MPLARTWKVGNSWYDGVEGVESAACAETVLVLKDAPKLKHDVC